MLISVHMPKTAGSSFKVSLKTHFGDSLMSDYQDMPINTPVLKRNVRTVWQNISGPISYSDNIKCIHGHFMPAKYLWMMSRKKPVFITWLREPAQRMVSHYHYWKKPCPENNINSLGALHKRMLEEQWDLERFVLCPELQNIYHKFFWLFPVSIFSFIGLTEHYDEDFKFFSQKFLGSDLDTVAHNVNEERKGKEYDIPPALLEQIRKHHKRDYQLYEHVLEQRIRRI